MATVMIIPKFASKWDENEFSTISSANSLMDRVFREGGEGTLQGVGGNLYYQTKQYLDGLCTFEFDNKYVKELLLKTCSDVSILLQSLIFENGKEITATYKQSSAAYQLLMNYVVNINKYYEVHPEEYLSEFKKLEEELSPELYSTISKFNVFLNPKSPLMHSSCNYPLFSGQTKSFGECINLLFTNEKLGFVELQRFQTDLNVALIRRSTVRNAQNKEDITK